MKRRYLNSFYLVVLIVMCQGCSQHNQKNTNAKRFAPDILGNLECFALTMEPDGQTFYVTAALRDGGGFYKSELKNDKWTSLQKIQFSSGDFNDNDFFPSPDGSGMYFFMSTRDDKEKPQNIWVAERSGESWSTLRGLDEVNSGERDGFPSVTLNGDLFFFSQRTGGKGSADIYQSRKINGQYTSPRNLGSPINTEGWDGLPYVSPNGKVMVFFSDRSGGFGKGDLYVSYFKDNKWSNPQNLGKNVNTNSTEVTPYIGPKGKYLYFARVEEVEGENRRSIYFIDLKHTPIETSYWK